MMHLRRICLGVAAVALLFFLYGLWQQQSACWQPAAVCAVVGLAVGIGAIDKLKNYQYTVWIIAAVVVAMIYPQSFVQWGPIDLRDRWLILIVVQIVMFGMGIQMSIHDFSGLARTGKGVVIGLICHFSIMPIMGFILTRVFSFDPEIAAGIILIGSCSSGLASNVMVYLARANLVLSVTVTAIATLAAPFLTPLLMHLLAGRLVEVKFLPMMLEIIQMVIVPIGAALLHDYLKQVPAARKVIMNRIAVVCGVWLLLMFLFLWDSWAAHQFISVKQFITILNFFAGAFIVGTLYHYVYVRFKKIDQLTPYLSMFGIVYFTTVTTAAGRDHLLQVGLWLFLAAVIHNGAGYFFGYWLARIFKMDKNSARTIAFEVGLQNGGMASGLAGGMGKLATVGLAAAVFSPWMNISGSLLANYWRKKTVEDIKDSAPC